LKKLNKYLLWNVVKYLILTEMAGLVMFTIIEFFEHVDVFTSSFTNFLLSVGYLALKSPYYINLILPLAFLVAMLTTFIVMIRGNEMVILRTSGISTLSLMKPFIVFSLILVVCSFVTAEWMIPASSSAAEYVYRVKIKKDEPFVFFRNDKIWFKRGHVINNIDFFDPKKDVIRGLTVLDLSNEYSVRRRFDALEGHWANNAWVFSDVTERVFDKDGIVSVTRYKTMSGLIKEPPKIFKVADINPEDMGYRDLAKYIARLRNDGNDIRRYLVDLDNKISFPFINIIMVFVAFSVGLRYVKTKHISKGIFSGVSVGVLYWFFHSICLSFGYSEIFPPLFAAWLSNLVFFSMGIIGIVTLRT
jgi:lipopolysaccharide export system permease protein